MEAKRGKERVNDLLLLAGQHYLRSLDVCDKLLEELPDRELLEMKSRLYLNLGLMYEIQEDKLLSAKTFMEKALGIVKYVGEFPPPPPPFCICWPAMGIVVNSPSRGHQSGCNKWSTTYTDEIGSQMVVSIWNGFFGPS